MFSHQERQNRIRGSAMAGSTRIVGALACLVSISAAASTTGQQAFLAPASSWFTAGRPDRHSAMMARKGTSMMSAVASETAVADAAGGVETRMWKWKGYDIRYKVAAEGSDGPPMVLIHGFGGNADHWRKNIPTLAKTGPVYAIDLLGYGFSSKPDPGPWEERNSIYCFETWSEQLRDFATEVVGKPVFMVCNSVGGVAGLQAGVDAPEQVLGVVLFNISLRMLHTSKQAVAGRPFVKGLQYVLRETPIGPLFFGSVAKPEAVSNILKQCYGDPDQVTEELVKCILTPGLEEGAVKVFLDFISYSGGPLPEDLLAAIKVPVQIAWGVEDPWEPMEQGKAYAEFDSVEGFVELPGAGHCPMDEAPHLTDPVVLDFVAKHYKKEQ
ncbi:conserved unknown protein [Ectocarpus siliculosus]|uniref:AB hydrolase-1 domain-containing protein n=1 Tax=Ectocarpus siliculosus TaxID=2880 RepID=D7G4N3_ECTSI|nr:conserved unknown protein [Ectocarpus siliculosus]|eukprot:CBJ33720.1 conserved unknown protein [Ectocarpus siliculosus]